MSDDKDLLDEAVSEDFSTPHQNILEDIKQLKCELTVALEEWMEDPKYGVDLEYAARRFSRAVESFRLRLQAEHERNFVPVSRLVH